MIWPGPCPFVITHWLVALALIPPVCFGAAAFPKILKHRTRAAYVYGDASHVQAEGGAGAPIVPVLAPLKPPGLALAGHHFCATLHLWALSLDSSVSSNPTSRLHENAIHT